MGFLCGSAGKESSCNVVDLGLIPGLRRSLGKGNGYPLQYSGLENSMGCTVRGGHKESDTTEKLSLSASGHLPGQGHLPAQTVCAFLKISAAPLAMHRLIRLSPLSTGPSVLTSSESRKNSQDRSTKPPTSFTFLVR